MPFPQEHSCRLKSPDLFQAKSFRRTKRKHDGKEYSIIMGKLKGETSMTEQSYRYPVNAWIESAAKNHCKDHKGILFEPAKDEKSMDKDMEIKSFKVSELRALGENKITGRIPYDSLSCDLNGFRERLRPGCFAKSIASGEKILSFWAHDERKPLGNTKAGTLELQDSQSALSFTIHLPSTSWGADAWQSVNRGDVEDCSFGFKCEKDAWDNEIRDVIQARLYEISPCAFGAYPETQVQARHLTIRGTKMDTQKLYELQDERAKITKDQRDLLERFGPNLTADAKVNYENMEKRFDELTIEIDKRHAGMRDTEAKLAALAQRDERLSQSIDEPIKVDPNDENRRSANDNQTREIADSAEMRIFNRYLVGGRHSLSRDELAIFERRALQMDSDTAGGFMISPEQFVKEVLMKLDDSVFIRQLAENHYCKNAHSLGIPYLADDPADSDWTAEIKTGTADSDMDLEKRALHPYPSAKRLLVSDKLLRATEQRAGTLVKDRLSYKFAITEEKAFMEGTGANQPLGLFTVHDSGIGTDRDISAGNTATAIKADNLFNVEGHLKAAYRRGARWIWHRDAIKMIRKLKDGDGNYIWTSGLQGAPDTILNYRYDISEYCPNTFTASQYVGLLGNLKFYIIATALDMQIKVLDQLYAETNQVGFIGRMEVDAQPGISEAFVRVQLAA